MAPKLYPEEREAARVAYDRIRQDQETITPFEAVIALKDLDISTTQDEIFKMVKGYEINFEKFCDIYEAFKDDKERKDLEAIVQESFEALGGRPNGQGILDINKLSDIFKFFEFDMDVDDFLRGQSDSEIVYGDYSAFFGLGNIPDR